LRRGKSLRLCLYWEVPPSGRESLAGKRAKMVDSSPFRKGEFQHEVRRRKRNQLPSPRDGSEKNRHFGGRNLLISKRTNPLSTLRRREETVATTKKEEKTVC